MKKQNEETQIGRGYNIVKQNDLIQKSRFNLSMQEQKIILYLISKINPEDSEFKLYEFKIREFCEVCGIESESGKNYSMLKNTIINLINKGFWVETNGEYVSMNWIEKARINPKSGTIKIRLDDDMKPYLLELKEKFTIYSLYFTLAMKSKYSLRIYELLKSYQNLGKCEFKIDQLKNILYADNYKLFSDFKRYVIDIAVREINNYGDISTSYELERQGRKVHKIKFTIQPKYAMDIDESIRTWKSIEKILNN
jgi:plasmid replication initiation protein